ncbi:MAG: tRNA (adenosine(37)-N6)-threonylcarbamoyltransferase complex ATPase subunit type 1 TsaE [Spirochaetales bacterium]|nr:tRNA (adenosine(37)-N6)-threonylcarbamoyltransferase complex ATPase subunit type 1 TsaE [Spirochaetales bacterium]
MEDLFTLHTSSLNETQTFATALGAIAWPGLIIGLLGPMGAGKTAFAQGFARGLGVRELVTSPTYAIIQEYHGGRVPLYHMDWYRLSSDEEVEETGAEEYFTSRGICLIEWPERGTLPVDSLLIHFSVVDKGLGRQLLVVGLPEYNGVRLKEIFRELRYE